MIFFSAGAGAQELSLETTLDRTETEFSELITLTYRLTYDPSQVALASDGAPRPEIKRLEFHSFSSSNRSLNRGGVALVEQEYSYQLKPIASGAGRIEPVSISYFLLPDSTSAQVLSEELKAQIAIPRPEGDSTGLPFWFWIALPLLALAGGVVFWFLRRGDSDSEDPHTVAVHTRLVLLKSLTAKPRSQFYETLYDALYDLAKDAGFSSARRGDSDRLLADISAAAAPGEIREPLVHWLSTSARGKFAPDAGQPGETLREYHEVEDFLRDSWLPFRRELDRQRARAEKTVST